MSRLATTIAFALFAVCSVVAQQQNQESSVANEPGAGPYVPGTGNGVKPPVVLHQPLPYYTEEARKARIEGIVLLQVVVRKNGRADSFKVLKSLGYGLDESAIYTIKKKWRFKPGTHNGVPANVQILIEVTFKR